MPRYSKKLFISSQKIIVNIMGITSQNQMLIALQTIGKQPWHSTDSMSVNTVPQTNDEPSIRLESGQYEPQHS